MTKGEDLENIELQPCPSCGSDNVSVRYAGHDDYFVGCEDCFNKRWCDEEYLEYTIERWNTYAGKVNARRAGR